MPTVKKKPEDKRPMGRPSLYKPEYCDAVLAFGAEGHSLTAMAALMGFPKATLQGWAQTHDDFAAALTRAMELSQLWWEEQGRRGLFADKFQSVVWKTSMAARFRDDYTERKEVTGAGGGPIQVQAVTLPIDEMDDEEVEQVEAVLLAALEKAEGGDK